MANASAGIDLWTLTSVDVETTGDRQLLERFVARRDEAAFAGLVQRHGRSVWNVCRRFLQREQDAEDAFQAVFLILARNAGSIRKGEAVGSWLYGVAYRLARKAKISAYRRQEHEKQVQPAPPQPGPSGESACRELQRVLDEEVMRLKEIYRVPFVLCCLERMSKAEAAKELGCNEGTVSSRLARARSILQARLARRGFNLGAILTAVVLAQQAAWAAAPAILLETTPYAVLATESGVGAGILSPSVVALGDSYLRRMRLASLGTMLAMLLSMFMLLGGAGLGAVGWRVTHRETAVEVVEPITFVAPGAVVGTPIDERVMTVAFSPDGTRLMTAGGAGPLPGQLKIWDVERAMELACVSKIPSVRSAAFSPDGKALATGDAGGVIALCDPATGEQLLAIKAHAGGVGSIAFSRDGEFLASAGLDRIVKLWSAAGLREQKVFKGHIDRVSCIAFFSHGQAIVTASQDRTARIWGVPSGQEKFKLTGHRLAVESAAISPDDKWLATASLDQTVKLWDAETGAEIAVLEGDVPQPFRAVAFSPDGAFIVAAGGNGTIQLWDTKTRQPAGTLEKHKAPIWALAFSRDGVLASGSADRTAKLWHFRGAKTPRTLTTSWASKRPIRAAAYSPDGALLAVATSDPNVHLRDAKTGDVIQTLHGHAEQANCLAFSPDGKILASGSDDHTIRFWDRSTGEELRVLTAHTGRVHAVAFGNDGKKLISAGEDKVIRIWDATNGNVLTTLKGHDAPILALALSPDGQMLASGGGDSIKLWNPADGAEIRSLKAHQVVRALVFSSDGLLASAGEDGVVKTWDAIRGNERSSIEGHTGAVLTLAFSPKGGALTSAGKDGTVRVWDSATGKSRGVQRGHQDAVTALAMHPHGHNLVSGSVDTMLLRWQAGKLPNDSDTTPAGDQGNAPSLVFTGVQEPVGKDAKKDERDAKADVMREFHRVFKGKPNDRQGLTFLGPRAQECIQFEEAGLRMTLPMNSPKNVGVGVRTGLTLKGDFELIMSFEILAEPDVDKAGAPHGTRLSLMAGWERQGQNAVKITRAVRPPQGSMFVAASRNRADKYDDKRISTQMKTGRLRVVRTGNVLFYFAAKDASDEFELLYQTTFNMDDLDNVRVLVLSGDREASFDVRIRELTIRADALVPGPVEPPQLPQPPPAIINQIGPGGLAPQPGPLILGPDGRLLTTVLPQDVGNVTPPRSEPPATASRGWLLAMLVIGALLILGFVLSVVGWLFLRRRALTVARPAASGQTVSFVCPQCGKALKTRVALAGKKVKCVKCGKSVPVPLSEPDDADIPVV